MRVYPNLKPRLMPEDIASLTPEQTRAELEKIVNHREKLIDVIEYLIEGNEKIIAKYPYHTAARMEQKTLDFVRDKIMVEAELNMLFEDVKRAKNLENSPENE